MYAKDFVVLDGKADPVAFLGQLISILAQARKEIADYKEETKQLDSLLRLCLVHACHLSGSLTTQILVRELQRVRTRRLVKPSVLN